MHEKSRVQTMCESMGCVSNSKRKKLSMSKVQNAAINVIASAVTTAIFGSHIVFQVTEERGYFAIGGEWVLILFFFYGFYKWISHEKKATHK